MEKERFFKLCEVILANRHKAEMMDSLGVVTTDIIPSDKVGFDFKVFYLDGNEIKRVYVENQSATGTENNPIAFEVGVELKPNTYYTYEDKKYVYMGTESVAESWESVADYMGEVDW